MKLNQITNKVKDLFKVHLFRTSSLISYVEVKDIMKENPTAILLDVRSKQEYDEYHLDGAICIPTFELESKIEKIIENKNQIIIVYCQSGGRAKKSTQTLTKIGYTNLYEIDGGIDNI